MPSYVCPLGRVSSGPNASEPVVYVAVIDSVGNWVYRLPAAEVSSIWPGISRKRIERSLQAAPARRPDAVNPCKGGYCYIFTSNCQATSVEEARAQGCGFNADQGFCGNWFARMVDTRQPLLPSNDCTRDVRGGKAMPWCVEMVDSSAPNAAKNAIEDQERRWRAAQQWRLGADGTGFGFSS